MKTIRKEEWFSYLCMALPTTKLNGVKELQNIYNSVDDTLEFDEHIKNVHQFNTKVCQIFGDLVLEKEGNTPILFGGSFEERGKRISKYFESKPRKRKEVVGTSVTKSQRLVRNAEVKIAEDLRSEGSILGQADLIKEAKKRLHRPNENQMLCLLKLLELGNKSIDYSVESQELKEVLKDKVSVINKKLVQYWVELVKPYGLNIMLSFVQSSSGDGRRWAVKILNNPEQYMEKLADIAKDLCNLDLVVKKRVNSVSSKKENVINLKKENLTKKYLIYYIAGMIVREGKSVNTVELGSILRNNNYRFINLSDQDFLELVRDYPEYFEKGICNKTIKLAGIARETWEKISKFNPRLDTWEIPWYIESGVKLEDVKRYFPESYQKNDKIFILVADKSIKSYQTLARFSEITRDCDFPIMESNDFKKKLSVEYEKLVAMFNNSYLLDNHWISEKEKNNRILTQLEEL